MLVLWAPDADVRRRVLDELAPDEQVVDAATWDEFRAAFTESRCGLVAEPEPGPERFGQLRSLRSTCPDGALVLVLRRNPRVLRRLKDVIVEEVVWMDEIGILPAALRTAETEHRLQRLERRVREVDHLPATLVDALVRSLRSRPPVTSVQELAADVDRDRRTLWHHWRNAVDERASGLTLKGFLDWIVLLRAAAMKTEGRSWHAVADELGVHARTLRRVAQRRTGVSLRDLSGRPGRQDDIFSTFHREAMVPLLDRRADPGRRRNGSRP